jgi:hypothetical protein
VSLPGSTRLDPAIHPFRKNFDAKKMDPRVKPAGDTRVGSSSPEQGLVLQARRRCLSCSIPHSIA